MEIAVSNESTPSQPQRAIRLIFRVAKEHVRLVTQQTTEMVVAETYPPGAAAPLVTTSTFVTREQHTRASRCAWRSSAARKCSRAP
jgi:hypothetical protein